MFANGLKRGLDYVWKTGNKIHTQLVCIEYYALLKIFILSAQIQL